MKMAAIVQARMGSQRLPGKLLREIKGKPVLDYLLERLEHSPKAGMTILAVSTDPSDDILETYAHSHGIACYRGSMDQVAYRYRGACDQFNLDAFIRVDSDGPLLDPALIDKAVTLFEQTGADLVTNVQERTFPEGESVEVVSAAALRQAFLQMSTPEQLENVTAYFYQHPGDFKIHNFKAHGNYGGVRFSIDTIADLSAFEGVVNQMTKPQWEYSWTECLELYKQSTTWLKTPLG